MNEQKREDRRLASIAFPSVGFLTASHRATAARLVSSFVCVRLVSRSVLECRPVHLSDGSQRIGLALSDKLPTHNCLGQSTTTFMAVQCFPQ